jgi:hypothetical protein
MGGIVTGGAGMAGAATDGVIMVSGVAAACVAILGGAGVFAGSIA